MATGGVGRGEEKEKYGRRREMGKDLRRWARASPLINHTRLYYFPFKLPPFRWPGGGEGEEESARERVGRELAARHKGGTGVQSIAAATFTDASHLLLARGINMSAESSNRGTASPLLFPLHRSSITSLRITSIPFFV